MSRLHCIISILISLQVLTFDGISSAAVEHHVKLSDEIIERLKKLGAGFKETLSLESDPCIDYYGYVCGKKDIINLKTQTDNPKISDILLEYFQNIEDCTKPELKLKNYWESCKQSTSGDFKNFVRNFNFPESLGGWPAFNSNWNGDKFDFDSAIAEFGSYSVSVIIDLVFDIDPRDLKKYLQVNVGDVNLLESDSKKQQLIDKLSKFGVENVDDIIKDATQFEMDCAEVRSSAESGADIQTDFKGLKLKIPIINWDKQMKIIVGQTLYADYPVIIKNAEILKKMIEAISKMNPKVVANHFFCKFINSLPELKEDTKEEDCLRYSLDNLDSVVYGILTKKFFTQDFLKIFAGMIQSITKELFKYFQLVEDKFTSADFEESIESQMIKEFSDESLTKEYESIELNSNNFLQNTYALRRHQKRVIPTRMFFEKSGTKVDIFSYMLNRIYTYSIFGAVNKPSSIAYKYIASDLILSHSKYLMSDRISNDTLQCLKRYSTDADLEDVLRLYTIQIYIKGYLDWTDKNQDLIQAENVFLHEYGLNSIKAQFVDIMQYGCGDMRLLLSLIGNTKEYADVFNCPIGSPMNPKEKCGLNQIVTL